MGQPTTVDKEPKFIVNENLSVIYLYWEVFIVLISKDLVANKQAKGGE